MKKSRELFGGNLEDTGAHAPVENAGADRLSAASTPDVERPGLELQAGRALSVRRSGLARITERLRSTTFIGALQRKPK